MTDGRSDNTAAGEARKKQAESRNKFFDARLKEMVKGDKPIKVPFLLAYCREWINEHIELDRISRNAKNINRVLESTLKKNLIKEDSFRQNKKYMNTLRHYKDQQNRKKKSQKYDTSNEKFEGMDIMEMASLIYDLEEENRLMKDIMRKYEERIQHYGKAIGAGIDNKVAIPPKEGENMVNLKASHLVALEIITYLYDNGAIITKNGYTHVSIDILSSKEILPSENFNELFREALRGE